MTRANNRDAIESELSQRPVAGLHFHYLDLAAPLLWLKRRTGFIGLIVYYYLWQLALVFEAVRLHRRLNFAITHHVTFCMDWMPSGLSVLRLPLVWGPVGGSTNQLPRRVDLRLPGYAQRHERIRRMVQTLFKRLDPLFWLTRRRASVILTFTDHALAGIPRRHRGKARSVVHIGFDERDVPASPPASAAPRADLQIVSGGRLVHWKGFDLLIEGFAGFVTKTNSNARLVITGDGRYRDHLTAMARQTGQDSLIDFVGRLPSRDDVYDLMHQSDLYALPTLRDGPPVAILEAMAAGLPIMCLDYGSTRELVPEGAGLKIPVHSREQIVRDITESLTWANSHRDELSEMGELAADHVRAVHDWDSIGDHIQEVYETVAAAQDGSHLNREDH